MDDAQALIEAVGRSLSDFREVLEITFRQAEEHGLDVDHVVELRIRTEGDEPRATLRLRCVGVRNLHLKDFGGGRTRLVGFDIVSLRDRQLEGIRWEVLDYENGDLGFVCRDIAIIAIE